MTVDLSNPIFKLVFLFPVCVGSLLNVPAAKVLRYISLTFSWSVLKDFIKPYAVWDTTTMNLTAEITEDVLIDISQRQGIGLAPFVGFSYCVQESQALLTYKECCHTLFPCVFTQGWWPKWIVYSKWQRNGWSESGGPVLSYTRFPFCSEKIT